MGAVVVVGGTVVVVGGVVVTTGGCVVVVGGRVVVLGRGRVVVVVRVVVGGGVVVVGTGAAGCGCGASVVVTIQDGRGNGTLVPLGATDSSTGARPGSPHAATPRNSAAAAATPTARRGMLLNTGKAPFLRRRARRAVETLRDCADAIRGHPIE